MYFECWMQISILSTTLIGPKSPALNVHFLTELLGLVLDAVIDRDFQSLLGQQEYSSFSRYGLAQL